MADNTTLDPGSGGDTFATAEMAFSGDTAKFQITGQTILSGSEGSWTQNMLVGGAGAVSAGTLRVTLGSNDPAVVALQLLDDAVCTDDAAFTVASDKGLVMMGVATADAVDSGDCGALAINTSRELLTSVETWNAGNLTVVGTGTFVVQEDGAALTALQLIDNIVVVDDAAFTAGAGSGVALMGFATGDSVDSGDVGVLAMDTSRNLKVSIEVDNAGIGGGTQYTEDAAAPANPVGNALLAERDDALGGITPIEGDWTHLFASANGALWVSVDGTVTVDNAGTFATQEDGAALTALQLIDDAVYADDADWTDGSSKHILVGGLFQSTPQTITDGDVGPLQVDTNGNLITVLGAAIPAGSNNIGDVDVLSVVPGTGATNLGKAEDSVHSTGDVGVMSLAVRNDTIGAIASTDGDYAPLQVNVAGALWVKLAAGGLGVTAQQVTDAAAVGSFLYGYNGSTFDALLIDSDDHLITTSVPKTAGGALSIFYDNDLDETKQEVKATAGQIYRIYAFNLASSVLYLQIFNLAAASVTVGTTVPLSSLPMTPSNGGFTFEFPMGWEFDTGITVAVTTGPQTAGAPGANECIVNMGYA